MEIAFIGLSAPVAIALVALIGYWYGRRQRPPNRRTDAIIDLKLHRTIALINQVESISDQLRRSMAIHHSNVNHCREQIRIISEQHDGSVEPHYQDSIKEMLGPTDRLSHDIAVAYDELRQQTNELTQLRSME